MRSTQIALALTRAGGDLFDQFATVGDVELFHYTDAAGLIGVLRRDESWAGELWANDVRCMNDTAEFKLGHDMVMHAVDARASHPAHSVLSRLLQHDGYVSGVVFATSFTRQGDLLSQWRAYADNGTGFALGFSSKKLTGLTFDVKNAVPHYLVRVEYDAKAQETYAEELVERSLNALQAVVGQTLTHEDDQMIVTALGMLVPTFAAICKNSGFSEEEECRIVLRSHQDPLLPPGAVPQRSAPQCSFRAGKYGITPFVKLRFPAAALTDAITSIVIGPRNAETDTEQKIRVLLANAGVKSWSTLPIKRAKATYR